MPVLNELGPRSGNLFEQVNDFMGDHAECSAIRAEAATYLVGCTGGPSDCAVTVNCICGASRSLTARRDESRDLVAIIRQFGIRVVER